MKKIEFASSTTIIEGGLSYPNGKPSVPEVKEVKDLPPVKVLVLGDVQGRFEPAFKAIENANKKAGPFDAALCVGQFFGEGSPIDQLEPWFMEEKKIPIPTYFVSASEPDSALIDGLGDGGEVLENLHYLGRTGVKDIAGLKVAFLSGRFSRAVYKTRPSECDHTRFQAREQKYDESYLEMEVEKLVAAAAAGTVDVLLTSEWGEGAFALQEDPQRLAFSSPVVAGLATKIAPRYHFAALENIYTQLAPFKTIPEAPSSTRFYGLGMVGNPDKVTWMKAFNIAPIASGAVQEEETTINPYTYVPPPKPAKEPEVPRIQHKTLPNGDWECALCGNVNYARQKDQCHMRKCAAPREGNLELWSMAKVSLKGKGVSGLGGGGAGNLDPESGRMRYGVMTAEAVAEAARAEREAAAAAAAKKKEEEEARNAPKRVSIYIGQKPMTKKQKR